LYTGITSDAAELSRARTAYSSVFSAVSAAATAAVVFSGTNAVRTFVK